MVSRLCRPCQHGPFCRQPASRLPVTRQKGNQDAQPHDAACTRRHTRDGSVARRARHSNNAGAQPRQSLCPNRLTHGPRHPLDTDTLKMVPTRIYAWAPYLVLAERSCYSAASSSSETSNSKSLPGRMALSTMPTSEPTAMPDSEIVTPPSSNTMAPAVLYAMPSESTSTSAATSTLRLFWKSTWFSMRLRTPQR